ncbi:hypothetical protein AB6A40_002498 [Gnathostoma spinigerum]|uniref:Mre11 DNA-binding domain-containing protein n=1 Tax=Gnathostoma spinigerum TaxID=75299 RepID=A0ABD6ECB8_9BILA
MGVKVTFCKRNMAGSQEALSAPQEMENTSANDMIKILVATDMHVGYGEKILNRDMDSVNTLEEVLRIGVDRNVDFVLFGGDLYHENYPSREMQYRVIRLLRHYCYSDRPVSVRFFSDPAVNFNHSAFNNVNYEDSNINVGMPIFTIHGNHDDTGGKGLTALDLLHEAGLINLFGKFEAIEHFEITPILLRKGQTNLAIYGIGSQRDDRLCRAFREEKISFLRPREDTESWFNILVLHQNRPKRSHDRSTGGHVPENLIPSFFDLVIWGHEHECKIEPQYFESGMEVAGDGFYIIQPGSTIATSLSPEEAVPKHCTVITVCGRKFLSTPIRLRTPRQVLFADLSITCDPPSTATKTLRPDKMPDEKVIKEKLKEMLENAKLERDELQPALPLVRIRVNYPEVWSGIQKLNVRRFGMNYSDEVANPADMISVRIVRERNERKKQLKGLPPVGDIGRATTVDDIISRQLEDTSACCLTVLTPTVLNEVIRQQVEVKEGPKKRTNTDLSSLRAQKEKLMDKLCTVPYKTQLVDPQTGCVKIENLEHQVTEDIVKIRETRLRAVESAAK